ncbi:hypothetical protein V9T40_012961 [Parthenolecanium corni]|uniref:Peptidase metallopeptidase domain-containing protein n=1 Tax=Parthenolecanium corni TaxID=536013 RepID=A0AAN9Y0Y5_9HEMI
MSWVWLRPENKVVMMFDPRDTRSSSVQIFGNDLFIVLSHSHGKLPARIELVRHQLQKAFSVWERHAKLRFSEKDYGVRNADIAISFVNRQHGDGYPFDGPGTVLAHAFSLLHSTRAEGIDGDIHFDGDEDWRFDERETKVHELGHSLGLTHVENRQSIMFPFYQRLESNFELHPYDRWLIQNIFGPPDRHRDPPNRNPTYPEHSSPRIPMPPNAGGGHPNPHYPRYPIFPNDEGRKNPDIPSYTKHQYSPSSPSTPGYPRSNPSANPPRSAPSVPAPKKPQTDEPNECNTNYDAISVIRGELFIFKGKYFWRIRDTKNLKSHSGPNLITRMWTKLPKDLTRVDAVFQRSSDVNKIVFFIGELMYQFDGLDLDPHYPKPLTSLRIDRSVDHIDAALVWGSNNRTYLFSGRYYWKLTEDEKSIEPDYPKDIKAWDGIGDNIDAAFQWTDGITYFFKGKGFWKFDDQRMKTRNQSPIPSAQVWMGCDKSSRYHVPDKFLTDRDPGLDTLSDTNVIPHSHEAHKNPSTPSPFGVSKLVISCVAVIVMLLLVTVVAVVAQRRRRKHSYQQPKWLKVNKKILM